MTDTHNQAASLWDDPWDALPEEGKRFHLARSAGIVKQLAAKLEANYGTPVEIIPASTKGSLVVYKARIGRYAKAFTLDTQKPAAAQRKLLDLQLGSLQAAGELRTILDLHGTIDPEQKR